MDLYKLKSMPLLTKDELITTIHRSRNGLSVWVHERIFGFLRGIFIFIQYLKSGFRCKAFEASGKATFIK